MFSRRYEFLENTKHVIQIIIGTRLGYYQVKTRLDDLVGLCWLKQNLVEQVYYVKVIIVDLDYLFVVGVCWLKHNLSEQIC